MSPFEDLSKYPNHLLPELWIGYVNEHAYVNTKGFKSADFQADTTLVWMRWTRLGEQNAAVDARRYCVPLETVKAACEHHTYWTCRKYGHDEAVINGPPHDTSTIKNSTGLVLGKIADRAHITILCFNFQWGVPKASGIPLKTIHIYVDGVHGEDEENPGAAMYKNLQRTSYGVAVPREDGKGWMIDEKLSEGWYSGLEKHKSRARAPVFKERTVRKTPPSLATKNPFGLLVVDEESSSTSSAEEDAQEEAERYTQDEAEKHAHQDKKVPQQKGKGKEKAEKNTPQEEQPEASKIVDAWDDPNPNPWGVGK